MIELHRGPVGRIRALPEVVAWEYGIAYAAIAEALISSGKHTEAIPMLQDADQILGELWRTRHDAMVRMRVPADAMREAVARYEWVLAQLTACLRDAHRDAEADAAATRLTKFRQEHDRETGAAAP
jgi:hypothetical protein